MEWTKIVLPDYPNNLLPKELGKRNCYHSSPKLCALIHNMNVYNDDVWIVTLPKSGTTWMQELMWLVLNNFDFKRARAEHLELRTPFLEFDYIAHKDVNRALEPVEKLKSPRFIKSHLPLPLLPKQLWEKKPKTVYVVRNPKDAWVSMYYHLVSVGAIQKKSLEEYVREFLDREINNPSQMPFEHVIEFYQLRHEPWLFYTSYERMKSNLAAVIQDVCKFLDKDINETQMKEMLHHLSFEQMKKNPMTQHAWEFTQIRQLAEKYEHHDFVRNGQVNGYEKELSPELIEKADRFIEEKLKEYNVTLNELLLLNE